MRNSKKQTSSARLDLPLQWEHAFHHFPTFSFPYISIIMLFQLFAVLSPEVCKCRVSKELQPSVSHLYCCLGVLKCLFQSLHRNCFHKNTSRCTKQPTFALLRLCGTRLVVLEHCCWFNAKNGYVHSDLQPQNILIMGDETVHPST